MTRADSQPAPTFDQEPLLWLGDEPPEMRAADAERIRKISAEFALGFDRLARIGPAVAVFGSARTPRAHPHYRLIREVGTELGRAGFAVITGGGGGLMEAANRGAKDAGALSVGCNIELPRDADHHALPGDPGRRGRVGRADRVAAGARAR